MYVDFQTIITISAVLAAIIAIAKYFGKAHKWLIKQDEQSKEIAHLKKESNILCECMAACLDGLSQLGANHTVPEAKKKMEDYLRDMAHS